MSSALMKLPTYAKVMNGLEHAVQKFVETGVHIDDTRGQNYADYYKNLKTNPIVGQRALMRKFMRCIAKDLQRPFIHVELLNTRVDLTVPHQKRTERLVAPILLASKPTEYQWSAYNGRATGHIEHRAGRCVWLFHFHGAPGKEIFEQLIESWRADPECRKVLKLT